MSPLTRLGYYFPDRPMEPPEPEGIACPDCGAEVHDYGHGYDCELCPWVDPETDRLLDAERDEPRAA